MYPLTALKDDIGCIKHLSIRYFITLQMVENEKCNAILWVTTVI